MAVNIAGGGSTVNKVNVTANYDLNVVTPQTEANAGFVQVSSEVDSGDVTLSRKVLPMEISDDYRIRVGLDQSIFNCSFEGASTPTHILNIPSLTMSTSQVNNFLQINWANTTTASAYVNILTRRSFTLFGTYPIYFDTWLREANHTASNAISEWGIGIAPSSSSAPSDGIFFRRNESGVLKAVLNYSGTETEITIDTTNAPSRDGVGVFDPTETNHYLLVVHNDICNFWINDVLVSSIKCPATQPTPCASSSQTLMYRVRNIGATSAGRQLHIGYINVTLGDQNTTKPWTHVLCGGGNHCSNNQIGSSAGQTSNFVNSTAPTLATLSNGSGSYTTLGGQYRFAATATNETDWALFAYTNPVGTTSLPGKTLYITNIRIGEMVITGAAGVNATMFFWSCSGGCSAVSLTTSDTTTSVSPRRVPLGISSFLAAAPIGTVSPGHTVDFSDSPLVVPPGTVFHVILKQLNGAATASLEFRGHVTVIGYFE